MAITAYPFDPQDTSEVQYMELMDAIADSGVVSGLALTGGAGMQILAAAGSGFVKGFFFKSTASEPRAVTAAHATLTRRDYIILKLDLAANTITLEVKAGTTSGTGPGGGTLPALTQNSATWEHPIGIIVVQGGVSSITTLDIIPQLASISRGIICYTGTVDRPAPNGRRQIGLNIGTGLLEFSDGVSWAALTIPWASVTGKPATFAPIIGAGATQAVAGNDSRLTDARTPTAHDINGATHTGTLSIANGGTGTTTAAGIRTAIGIPKITVQTAATADPAAGNTVGDLLIEY